MKELRRAKIVDMILEKGSVKIKELSEALGTSAITIYRDLEYLEKQGAIIKLRGGAMANTTPENLTYSKRACTSISEKTIIAKKAVELINEGDSVVLDGSTTNIYVAKELSKKKDITVYTTSPTPTNELLNCSDIILYSIGGLYTRELDIYVGSELEEFISKLNVKKAIIGSSAVCAEVGITGPYNHFASIQRKIISVADEVILVADNTKFDRVAIEKVATLDKIDHIVVDSGLDKEYIKKLRRVTDVIVAE